VIELFVAVVTIRVISEIREVIVSGDFNDNLVLVLKKKLEELIVEVTHEEIFRIASVLSTRVDVIGQDKLSV
jgi:hypothetical protein